MNNIPAHVIHLSGSEITVMPQNKEACPPVLRHGVVLPAQAFRVGDVGCLNYHSTHTRGRWIFTVTES